LRPAVRPCGRRTDPRGVSRASRGSGGRSSVQIWLGHSRRSVSAACRYSFHHREPLTVEISDAPLVASRAPSRSRTRECRRQAREAQHALLDFAPLQRLRNHGFGCHGRCRTRHLPSSAFLTLSTVCTPQSLPGLFHPGNAHGVPSSGLCSSPGSAAPLSKPLLSCRFGRPSPTAS
jgi:hypothetical protein